MRLSLIAAIGKNRELGISGSLPWKLPQSTDLARFRQLTVGHTVIIGRRTYKSIGRQLPGRTNIVLSRDPAFTPPGCLTAHSFDAAWATIGPQESETFIIGGAEIYAVAISIVTRMYLTHVAYSGPADAYFPDFDLTQWEITGRELHSRSDPNGYNFEYVTYDRIDPIDSPAPGK